MKLFDRKHLLRLSNDYGNESFYEEWYSQERRQVLPSIQSEKAGYDVRRGRSSKMH